MLFPSIKFCKSGSLLQLNGLSLNYSSACFRRSACCHAHLPRRPRAADTPCNLHVCVISSAATSIIWSVYISSKEASVKYSYIVFYLLYWLTSRLVHTEWSTNSQFNNLNPLKNFNSVFPNEQFRTSKKTSCSYTIAKIDLCFLHCWCIF